MFNSTIAFIGNKNKNTISLIEYYAHSNFDILKLEIFSVSGWLSS